MGKTTLPILLEGVALLVWLELEEDDQSEESKRQVNQQAAAH